MDIMVKSQVDWTKIGAIFTILSFILIIILNIPQITNLFGTKSEDTNSYIALHKAKNDFFSNKITNKYLKVNTNQPDSLKEIIIPPEIIIGEQTSFTLRIDGNNENRKIKVIITDPNGIIRFADEETARYLELEQNLINESTFEADSHWISIKKKIIVDLNIFQSNSEIIQGDWKLIIIILKDDGEVSLYLSHPLNVINQENTSYFNIFSILLIVLIIPLIIILNKKFFRNIFISFESQ